MIFKNKKGSATAIVLLSVALIVILFLGFGVALLVATVSPISREISNTVGEIGDVGGSDFSEINDMTLKPVSESIQTLKWLSGFGLALSFLMLLGLAVSFRFSGSRWLVALFLLFALLTVIISMMIANSYSDFHSAGDELGAELREMTLVSWLILNGPMISSIMIFICGIIMFTGRQEEAFV